MSSSLLSSPADAADPKVLNYLSWPGNADPAIVGEFEKAHGVKIRIKEYVGGDQMMAVVNQSPPGTYDVVLADANKHLLKAADFIEPLDPPTTRSRTCARVPEVPADWIDNKLYGVMLDFGYLGISYNTKAFTAKGCRRIR